MIYQYFDLVDFRDQIMKWEGRRFDEGTLGHILFQKVRLAEGHLSKVQASRGNKRRMPGCQQAYMEELHSALCIMRMIDGVGKIGGRSPFDFMTEDGA